MHGVLEWTESSPGTPLEGASGLRAEVELWTDYLSGLKLGKKRDMYGQAVVANEKCASEQGRC